jgi:EAL domain-containing protein (putative c-di-GMP-specific phosphodiesterase class I)
MLLILFLLPNLSARTGRAGLQPQSILFRIGQRCVYANMKKYESNINPPKRFNVHSCIHDFGHTYFGCIDSVH